MPLIDMIIQHEINIGVKDKKQKQKPLVKKKNLRKLAVKFNKFIARWATRVNILTNHSLPRLPKPKYSNSVKYQVSTKLHKTEDNDPFS